MLQAVKLKGHFNIYSHISINAGYLFLVTPTPYFGHPANTVAVRTCRCHDGFPAALSSSFLLQATPTSRSGPLRLTNSSSLTLTSKSLLLITILSRTMPATPRTPSRSSANLDTRPLATEPYESVNPCMACIRQFTNDKDTTRFCSAPPEIPCV